MTDKPSPPRFLVRRGARGDFMVWDRQAKGPAKLEGRLAVGLTEEAAREINDVLIKIYTPD